jgi:hypothetical protein
LDEFWWHRYQQRIAEGLTPAEEMGFLDIEEVAIRYAWTQVIMAMSRPIDTLVITLKDTSSELAKSIINIAKLKNDYADVIS